MFLRWRKMSCLDWRAVTVLGARTRRATTRGRTSVGSCTAQRGARGGLPAGEPAIEKGLSQKTHQARRTCGRTSKTPTWVSICSQGGPEGLLLRVLQSQDNSTCSIDHLARCISCGREFGGCRGLSAVHSGVLFQYPWLTISPMGPVSTKIWGGPVTRTIMWPSRPVVLCTNLHRRYGHGLSVKMRKVTIALLVYMWNLAFVKLLWMTPRLYLHIWS